MFHYQTTNKSPDSYGFSVLLSSLELSGSWERVQSRWKESRTAEEEEKKKNKKVEKTQTALSE